MHHAPQTGLYIHIPYCLNKCGYCDFFSVPVENASTRQLLISLECELDSRLDGLEHPIRTIFCGGGTPTSLPLDCFKQLCNLLQRVHLTHKPVEVTLEANPKTIDPTKMEMIASAGVNRISVGAQSFHEKELAILERQHAPDDVRDAISLVRAAGIDHINMDLIFGIPGQTLQSWKTSIEQAIELGVDHLSCYGLTYEPGTRLTNLRDSKKLLPVDEQLESEMYLLALDLTSAHEIEQYEISNFAKPGCECRHNINYWRNGSFVGVGPSAAGCVNGRRYKNTSDVARYTDMINDLGYAEEEAEVLDRSMRIDEALLMQLRTVEGLDLKEFQTYINGDAKSVLEPALTTHASAGRIHVTDSRIALTRAGMMIADTIIADLAASCSENTA